MLQPLRGFTGVALAAFLAAACSPESGTNLIQKLEREKRVRFNAVHLACRNTELLDEAESFQRSGYLYGIDVLRGIGQCEVLPANTTFAVVDIVKEDGDTAVIGVTGFSSSLAAELYTRYRLGD
ncbi:MAG TPA: hypothetical protein VF472_07130 [Burkholderiaceae bacterium]